MSDDLPRGAVTFVFTDVEGSTRLARELGSRWAEVLAAHRALVRERFSERHGHEIDFQGDSFFFAFAHARDALLAAADTQRALAAHEWPAGVRVKVRIGVHSGQAQLVDGRYVGPAVHRAARIGAAASGGHVLASRTSYDLVEDEEALDGLVLQDMGEFRLKDFDRPVRLYSLVREGERSVAPRAERVSWTRRRIAAAVGAGIVVAAAAAGLATGLSMRGGTSTSRTVQPNSVAVIDPQENRVVDQVQVGFRPGPVAVGEGAVWVSNLDEHTVSRIDPKTAKVVQAIPVGGSVGAIGVGYGAVWLVRQGTNQPALTRVEPESGAIVTTATTSKPGLYLLVAKGIAFSGGDIWAGYTGVSDYTGAVMRADPAENRILSFGEQGFDVRAVAAGLGSVWVGDPNNELVQMSPQDGRVTAKVSLAGVPSAVAVGAGAVWVALPYERWLVRVRSQGPGLPFAVDGVETVGKDAGAVAVGEGGVWVANAGDGTVSKIDPATNHVVATVHVGNVPTGVAVGAGRVWVTVQGRTT